MDNKFWQGKSSDDNTWCFERSMHSKPYRTVSYGRTVMNYNLPDIEEIVRQEVCRLSNRAGEVCRWARTWSKRRWSWPRLWPAFVFLDSPRPAWCSNSGRGIWDRDSWCWRCWGERPWPNVCRTTNVRISNSPSARSLTRRAWWWGRERNRRRPERRWTNSECFSTPFRSWSLWWRACSRRRRRSWVSLRRPKRWWSAGACTRWGIASTCGWWWRWHWRGCCR